ncbi:transmembrane protein 64 [Neocloeon triangulifer]|uniref:transmembrane protein 64 n=1 Tax=Neocloeon triangulifer TaxID=2078957 RepID=UPI00286EF36D|nr:transmembrane protein 64 [Neocloeon triangulifer]
MTDPEKQGVEEDIKVQILSVGSVCNCLISALALVSLGFIVYQCKDYLRFVLLWIEQQDSLVVYLIFVVLFTLVSFPFTWGYIFLNLACGYLFGTLKGLFVVAVAALIGITVAHYLIQTYFADLAMQRLFNSETAKALLAVISGPHAFKVILFARLTPIPYGLQNTIFAGSNISYKMYLLASATGLFPTQVINVYLGSTLRSMEDVLSDESTASTGYLVFAVQILVGCLLMTFVVHKARAELKSALDDTEKCLKHPYR